MIDQFGPTHPDWMTHRSHAEYVLDVSTSHTAGTEQLRSARSLLSKMVASRLAPCISILAKIHGWIHPHSHRTEQVETTSAWNQDRRHRVSGRHQPPTWWMAAGTSDRATDRNRRKSSNCEGLRCRQGTTSPDLPTLLTWTEHLTLIKRFWNTFHLISYDLYEMENSCWNDFVICSFVYYCLLD